MDINELAHRVVQRSTTGDDNKDTESKRDASRRAGRVGGRARAAALSPEERRAIAIKANRARWKE